MTETQSAENDAQRQQHEAFVAECEAKGTCWASGLRIASCMASICDCFRETHPDSPYDLHPEDFIVGRVIPPAESWARAHHRETGHPTTASLTDPGSCNRCAARAPGWDIRVTPPGLHACVGCGAELDGDDPNDRCDECPIPPASPVDDWDDDKSGACHHPGCERKAGK